MGMNRIAWYARNGVVPPYHQQMTIARYIRQWFAREPAWVEDILGPRSNTKVI